jgi:phosphohistidine phosphatase SixA
MMLMLMNSPSSATELLWEKIRAEPNIVLLMRHADAEPGNALRWDESGKCEGEVQLSEDGKDHARYIGVRFAARRLEPVVVSSPMCRCKETAVLAFGGSLATDPLLRELPVSDTPQSAEAALKAKALIASHRGKAPLVFVGHASNITQLTHETVAESEAVVGIANADGDVAVLGKVVLTD